MAASQFLANRQLWEQEVAMVEHYVSILLLKPKNCVLCHQPVTLKESTMTLMEVYASAEAGLYLLPKAWGKHGAEKGNWPGLSEE